MRSHPHHQDAPCSRYEHLWKLPSMEKELYCSRHLQWLWMWTLFCAQSPRPDVLTSGKHIESEGLIYTYRRVSKIFHWRLRFEGGVGVNKGHLWGENPQQREQQMRRGSGLCMGQLNCSFFLTMTEYSSLYPHKGLKRWSSISSLCEYGQVKTAHNRVHRVQGTSVNPWATTKRMFLELGLKLEGEVYLSPESPSCSASQSFRMCWFQK